MKYPYRVWAEIDLAALARNLEVIRSRLAPETKLILVVKADAYGHGAVPIAAEASRCGVDMLGVGDSREAMEIIQAGVELPILILGTIIDEEIGAVVRQGIQVGIHSTTRLEWLSEQALRARRRLQVHLNLDTGMGRLGLPPAEAERAALKVLALPGLELAGIYTHFAHASWPPNRATRHQEGLFAGVVEKLRGEGLLPRRALVHAAKSASIFTNVARRWDAVRPGLAAYGALPRGIPGARELTPVLTLKSQVIFYKDVPAGTPVGYDAEWIAEGPTRIATVPAGYNDGIPWRTGRGGKSFALVRGRPVPYAGQVSMDYLCLDIGQVPGVRIGEPVTLIGRDGERAITAGDLARAAGTSPYEILCSLGKRVERVPVRQPGVSRWADGRMAPGTLFRQKVEQEHQAGGTHEE